MPKFFQQTLERVVSLRLEPSSIKELALALFASVKVEVDQFFEFHIRELVERANLGGGREKNQVKNANSALTKCNFYAMSGIMSEKRITIPLPKPTHDKLERLRKARGTSKHWEARNLLVSATDKEPDPKKP